MFCAVLWVREFQSSEDGVNARVVASSGFGSAAYFSVLKLGPRMLHIDDNFRHPCGFFCTLVMQSSGARTLRTHASKW